MLEQDTQKKRLCPSCQRYLSPSAFYKNKNKTDYLHNCKACMASMIKLRDPATLERPLKEMNVPFVPYEWFTLVDRYEYDKNGKRNPKANQVVLGRYFSKMKLIQWRDFTWEDTPQFLEKQKEYEKEKEEAVKKDLEYIKKNPDTLLNGTTIEEAEEILRDSSGKALDGTGLTRKEIKRLQDKWGDTYAPNTLKRMETLYQEMHSSYDIDTASHEDYLRKIVRVSVAMDDALIEGDVDTATKYSTAYDKMMKSAKFTASQVDEEENYIGSIGELVRLCEEEDFIPKSTVTEDLDIVDYTIKDLELYYTRLVTQELNLDTMVQQSLELINKEEAKIDNETPINDDDYDDIGDLDAFLDSSTKMYERVKGGMSKDE